MKTWEKPVLEILDIRMTMNGPGNANADCFDVSDGREETHEGRSNASCLDNGASPFDS
ncbi:paeninodin family lasso peptide [Ornithinibacillus gellani]|uniref:paeninodin family lasso peptide n=1 Tax=Ornithinibacillus gellani TaxID=2293253 RepID=UPI000F46CA21|nr:paeninodin family lasso peptide [Ornithinibacillus gellani]TQS74113.1 paeninodin family lasso peptide [Ornithinibacillus gellani]